MTAESRLEKLIERLEDPLTLEALEKTLELLRNLNESGLLDILAALTDPEVTKRLLSLAINTGTLRLADRAEELAGTLARVAEALAKPVEPATPARIIAALRDPDVARGIALMLEILRALGQRRGSSRAAST